MHIFASLTKVEGALQVGAISRPSSRQAELAGDSVANTVSPTIDLVARMLGSQFSSEHLLPSKESVFTRVKFE